MKISRIWILNLAALIVLIIVISVGHYTTLPAKKKIRPISSPSKLIVPGVGIETKRPPKPSLSPRQMRKDGISPEEEWTNIEKQMEAYFKDRDDEQVQASIKEMDNDLDKQIDSVKKQVEENPANEAKKLLLKDLKRLKKTLSKVK